MNQNIYDDYAIQGWPCWFHSPQGKDAYNKLVAKYCSRLSDDAKDLTPWMKIKLCFHQNIPLRIKDAFWDVQNWEEVREGKR